MADADNCQSEVRIQRRHHLAVDVSRASETLTLADVRRPPAVKSAPWLEQGQRRVPSMT